MKNKSLLVMGGAVLLTGVAAFSIGRALPKDKDYVIDIKEDSAYVYRRCDAPVSVFSQAEQELKMKYVIKSSTPITDKDCTVAIRYEIVKTVD